VSEDYEFSETRHEIDLNLRRKLENACKVALRRSGASLDEHKVKECVKILEEYISEPDEFYQADIEAQLKNLGIRESYASKLAEFAIRWSRRR